MKLLIFKSLLILSFLTLSYDYQRFARSDKSLIINQVQAQTLRQTNHEISVNPSTPIQGEPLLASISGLRLSDIKNVTFGGVKYFFFSFRGKPSIFVGVDLNKKPGNYDVVFTLKDGRVFKQTVDIAAREKIEAPLGIPEKLGGNTPQSQKTLIDTLAAENKTLENILTSTRGLWKYKFIHPVENPTIVDHYGYSRKTGAYNIAHKGTDYKAEIGTPILAMNRGVVRIAKTYRNYGQTIVIDHGLGLQTFYMHLSKMNVKAGQIVDQGHIVGLSGDTGYATGPHLHLTVRINGISIDPIKFLGLFDKKS